MSGVRYLARSLHYAGESVCSQHFSDLLPALARLFSLPDVRCISSNLHSHVNIHYAFGMILLSFYQAVYSNFLKSTRVKEDPLLPASKRLIPRK